MKALMMFALALAFLAGGCKSAAVKEVERVQEVVELDDSGRIMAFEMLRPQEKLSDWERQVILAFQVKRLAGPGWREARKTLVAMGKDSIPVLIQALDRDEEAHHEFKPRQGPQSHVEPRVFTLGDMAYDVLRDIVMHYSNFRGEIPPLSRTRWERWWDSNGSGLVVLGRGRALTSK